VARETWNKYQFRGKRPFCEMDENSLKGLMSFHFVAYVTIKIQRETVATFSRTIPSRVARFFLVQFTNTVGNVSNNHKIYQISIKYIKWL
jgi:hypothetical protein